MIRTSTVGSRSSLLGVLAAALAFASDWWAGGPEGAGYYKPRAGGGYVKLETGLGQ